MTEGGSQAGQGKKTFPSSSVFARRYLQYYVWFWALQCILEQG